MGLYKLLDNKRKEKKRKQNMKLAKIATVTTAVGLAAGTLSGVLLAPKSGKETRQDIKEKSSEIGEKVKVKAIDTKEIIKGKVSESRNDLKEAKSKIAQYLANKKNVSEEVEVESEENIEEVTENVDNLYLEEVVVEGIEEDSNNLEV